MFKSKNEFKGAQELNPQGGRSRNLQGRTGASSQKNPDHQVCRTRQLRILRSVASEGLPGKRKSTLARQCDTVPVPLSHPAGCLSRLVPEPDKKPPEAALGKRLLPAVAEPKIRCIIYRDISRKGKML